MPGKQMSHRCRFEFRSHHRCKAKQRRKDIQSEAEFYMPWMVPRSWLKGDAIASMIIFIVNLIAGSVIEWFRVWSSMKC